MSKVPTTIRGAALLLAAGLIVLAGSPGARAGVITFTTEHVDVDLRFEAGRLAIGWHDEDNDIEYEADEARVLLGGSSIRPRPAGSAFDFIGVGPGAPVFILPQVQDPSVVFLGLGTEEIDNGLFQNNQVTLSLVAVRGPGAFSIWGTDAFGSPTVVMTTTNGITPADQAVLATSSDAHFNWGFTAPGSYEIDFRLSGVLLSGQTIQSDVTTLVFEVAPAAIPEPASVVLLALGAGVACGVRWWRG